MIITGSRFSAERRKREKQYEKAIRFGHGSLAGAEWVRGQRDYGERGDWRSPLLSRRRLEEVGLPPNFFSEK
jgi:hypothetical protein